MNYSPSRQKPYAFILCFLFIFLFAAENCAAVLLCQEGGSNFPLIARVLFFNTLAALFIALVPRVVGYPLLVVNTAANIGIFTWHRFLGDVPSLAAGSASMESDLFQGLNPLDYVDWKILIVLLVLLGVKLYLLHRVHPFSPRPKARFASACLVLVLFAVSGLIHLKLNGLSLTRQGVSLENSIVQRGYMATWFAELVDPVLPGAPMTCSAEKVKTIPAFPVTDKVAYIQVECLDWALLGRTSNGQALMPFVETIASKGLLLRLDGIKKLSSSNSDYELLNTRVAHPGSVYYKLVKEYPDSMVRVFKERGAHTSAFHGLFDATGMVTAYPAMGFDTVMMREDYEKAGYALNDAVPPHIDDRDLLHYGAELLPKDGPFFQLLITMNMHNPARSGIHPAFKGDKDAALYTNIRITDDGIKRYVESLPPDTTVIVMGDHSAYYGPTSKYIPLIIYRTGGEQPPLQTPDVTLTRCEASQYLRHIFDMPLVSSDVPVVEEMCR